MESLGKLLHHPVCILVWVPLLFGLQGVPHTGGLRTLFLLIGMVHLIGLWRTAYQTAPLVSLGGVERKLFWLLPAWLLFQAVLIAQDPAASIEFLVGNWGKLLLMAMLGVWFARFTPDGKWLTIALFAGAFLHVIEGGVAMVISFALGGSFAFGEYSLGNYALSSSFASAALVFLLADLGARFLGYRSLFPWRLSISVLLALITLFITMMLKAKSGQLVGLMLLLATILAMLGCKKGKRRGVITMIAAITTGIALLLTMTDAGSRWRGLDASLQAALHEPVPVRALMTDDIVVPQGLDHSLYVRGIRYRVGIEGIADHPLGLGYTADVFRRYVSKRFDLPVAINSSNSGLIDFGLASGFPGLLLLLALTIVMMRRGWQAFVAGNPEGLALTLLVLQHVGRYVLDGTLAGSRFTGMAFAIGVLWSMSASRLNAPHPSH